jgi:hypothetical protein
MPDAIPHLTLDLKTKRLHKFVAMNYISMSVSLRKTPVDSDREAFQKRSFVMTKGSQKHSLLETSYK